LQAGRVFFPIATLAPFRLKRPGDFPRDPDLFSFSLISLLFLSSLLFSLKLSPLSQGISCSGHQLLFFWHRQKPPSPPFSEVNFSFFFLANDPRQGSFRYPPVEQMARSSPGPTKLTPFSHSPIFSQLRGRMIFFFLSPLRGYAVSFPPPFRGLARFCPAGPRADPFFFLFFSPVLIQCPFPVEHHGPPFLSHAYLPPSGGQR